MRRTIALCLWIAMPLFSACSPSQLGGSANEAPQVQGGAMRPLVREEVPSPAQGASEPSRAPGSPPADQPPASAPASPTPEDAEATAAIIGVHGGAGPWVVAGYRMGLYALRTLNLAHGSFDLEVTHHSPREVQYSCIADGAAAATGASLGRLSLSLAEAPAPQTRTTYRKRSTGEQLTLRVTPEFAARYKDVPRPQLMAAGQEVLHLQDADIFNVVP